MTRRFSVLVTDGNAKHSIALQRHLRRALPDVRVVANAPERIPFCKYQRGADIVCRDALEHCLESRGFDMVIPVSAAAVRAVARLCPDKAVLPPQGAVDTALDKAATMELADELQVPHPRSWHVSSVDMLETLPSSFPVVIKPANETELKEVHYAADAGERRKLVQGMLERLPGDATGGVLVQEYVNGVGRGFFAVYANGRPVRSFMHERLRETPPSGGASTAARAIYDERLKEYACRLLNALEWHGPAMVEFKFDPISGQYSLLEINPKLWGSLELGLSAGVDFGATLVRIFRGETVEYSDAYDRDAVFVWPLDGDLEVLAQSRQLSKASEYFSHNVKSNLFQSLRVDLIKVLLIFRSASRNRREERGL